MSWAHGQPGLSLRPLFGEHILATCECAVDELNGEKLKDACKKMKSACALGADGWRVAELQALPLQLFATLAQVLILEETGTWPTPFTCGLISLIQKGEGSAPQKTEADWPSWLHFTDSGPPCGFATFCIGRRNGLTMRWHGYRLGRRAEDVWIDLSMTVESALADGSDLVGMSINWSKCFDRVPQGIAFHLAERHGLQPRVLQPLRGMFRELRRRVVMAGSRGEGICCL